MNAYEVKVKIINKNGIKGFQMAYNEICPYTGEETPTFLEQSDLNAYFEKCGYGDYDVNDYDLRNKEDRSLLAMRIQTAAKSQKSYLMEYDFRLVSKIDYDKFGV